MLPKHHIPFLTKRSFLFVLSMLSLCILLLLNQTRIHYFYSSLRCTYHALLAHYSDELVLITDVPRLYQYPELPTGCEVTTLTMLLQYYGIAVTKETLAEQLPKAPLPTNYDGTGYTLHPNEAFIGDPFSEEGFGVYLPPLIPLIQQYLSYPILNLTQCSFTVLQKLLDQSIPIMVWATMEMRPAYLTRTWLTPEGPFTWTAPQHALLLIGYDTTHICVHGPLHGLAVYKQAAFLDAWEALGKQALAILH